MELETLNRKMRQLIIHSFIYYHFNDNIWSDSKWDKTAKEVYGAKGLDIFKETKFYEVFKDFDGCTGYGLVSYQWIKEITPLDTQSYQHHFLGLSEYLIKMEK